MVNLKEVRKKVGITQVELARRVGCGRAYLCNIEKEYPEDKRPRKAINAARAWLENDSVETRKAAAYAAAAASAAAAAAAYAAAAAAMLVSILEYGLKLLASDRDCDG